MPGWREWFGPRFARLTTVAVVRFPGAWRLLRGTFRRQWDLMAPSWEARRGPDALAPLQAALDRVERATAVLDVGTGTGKAARVAAERFPAATVVGIDFSPAMVAEAMARLPPALAGRVCFAVEDAEALSFPDGSFDLVVLLNMIPFFGELARVTVSGGALVLAFYSGPATPIYVPSETLRARLSAVGFAEFEELAAGEGTAFVARRA